MLQIALIRSGSSDYDRQGRIQGSLDIPLCEAGRQEVAEMMDELKAMGIDALYGADCQPTLQTATNVALHLGVKLKPLSRLSDVNQGLWQGCLVDEVRRKHPRVFKQWEEGAENVCPPQGETLGQARQRIRQTLQQIFRKHRHGTVAIVLPRMLCELAVSCLTHGDLGTSWAETQHGRLWNVYAPWTSIVVPTATNLPVSSKTPVAAAGQPH